jgi:hypothetical protein
LCILIWHYTVKETGESTKILCIEIWDYTVGRYMRMNQNIFYSDMV